VAAEVAITTLAARNAITVTPTRRFAMGDPQASFPRWSWSRSEWSAWCG
jgi:hypothetical protein